MTTLCPLPDRLQALLDGKLPEAQRRQCTEHLEHCRECRQRIEELAGDVEGMPDRTQPACSDQPESSPAMERAMDRLRAVDLDTNREQAADTDPGAVDFLSPTDKPGYIGCFGPYDVIEVVGRGGMGVVLKARDPSLHRIVAIKVLSPTLATSAVARQRFIREARAAAAVSHDHVVTIHAVDEVDRLPYLMMQFISGQSLQQRIDRSGPLQPKEILRIGMQTASGLAAAHALGLIHRDIKPANVLLENGIERAMLTDFGLAKAAHDVAITQTGLIAGTPEYMAPEQVRDEPIDHRADLFSLGGVLYAMCTGRPPFAGSTPLSVMRKVCEEAPPAIREINEEVPGWLAEIVGRLLSKDRSQRYQSAAEVARLLGERLARLQSPEGLAAGDAEQPRPDRSRAERWLGRLVIGVLLVALAAAVFGLKTLLDSGPNPVHIPGDSQSEPQSRTFVIVAEGSEAGRSFETLAEAVAAAQSGDTIEVRWNGTCETNSIRIGTKPLVIRAAEGFRPTIEVQSDEEPLLLTDAFLALEGLELKRRESGLPSQPVADPKLPLVWSMQSELHVANCRFTVRAAGDPRANPVAVRLENVARCRLRNCEFYGENGAAVHWFQRDGRSGPSRDGAALSLQNCVHGSSYVILLGLDGQQTASLRLERNTLLGATMILPLIRPFQQDAAGVLTVEASQNVLDFAEFLVVLEPKKALNLDDGPEVPPAEVAKRWFAWKGRRNVLAVEWGLLISYPATRAPRQFATVLTGRSLEDWNALWDQAESGSLLAEVVYPGGTRRDQPQLQGLPPLRGRRPPRGVPDESFRKRFVPRDFRLVSVKPDDGDALAAEQMAEYGADLDLVGPGKPYDRWRETAEYQQWLEDVQRAMAGPK